MRVVEKLGLRHEGSRPAFLHIDGAWRDHEVFAVHSDEVPGGLLARWRAHSESAAPGTPPGDRRPGPDHRPRHDAQLGGAAARTPASK